MPLGYYNDGPQLSSKINYVGEGLYSTQQCKPDYEAMINKLYEKRTIIITLLNDLYSYLKMKGYNSDQQTREYIGQLELESRDYLLQIENLMTLAENQ